jgi:hypothetical protein
VRELLARRRLRQWPSDDTKRPWFDQPDALQQLQSRGRCETLSDKDCELLSLAKKDDVFFWHGMTLHGGGQINDPSLTRRSFVIHYSSKAQTSKAKSSAHSTGKIRDPAKSAI